MARAIVAPKVASTKCVPAPIKSRCIQKLNIPEIPQKNHSVFGAPRITQKLTVRINVAIISHIMSHFTVPINIITIPTPDAMHRAISRASTR